VVLNRREATADAREALLKSVRFAVPQEPPQRFALAPPSKGGEFCHPFSSVLNLQAAVPVSADPMMFQLCGDAFLNMIMRQEVNAT
jgi:hypothetical protein